MLLVPIKSEEQQQRLMVHRARQRFVEARTAAINHIRGLLSEFGIVLPLKASTVRREAANRLEELAGYANTVIGARTPRRSDSCAWRHWRDHRH